MNYHNHISVKRHCEKLQQMATTYNELSTHLNEHLRSYSADIPEDLPDSVEYDEIREFQRRITEFLQRVESIMHSFDVLKTAKLG